MQNASTQAHGAFFSALSARIFVPLKKTAAYLASFFLLAVPIAAHAYQLNNPLGYDTLTEFLQRILQLVIEIGFPVIVLFIVLIGFRFVQAEGNAEKLAKLRGQFLWVMIGALIVLGAQALSIAIQGTVRELGAGV